MSTIERPPGIDTSTPRRVPKELRQAARLLLEQLEAAELSEVRLVFDMQELCISRRRTELPALSSYETSTVVFLQRAVRRWLSRKRLFDAIREARGSRLAKTLRQRRNLAQEMLSSEETYLAMLQRCVDDFLLPTRHGGLVDASRVKTIFQNIDAIAGLSAAFVGELRERLAAWPSVSSYGDVVDRHIKGFVSHYETYLLGYKPAMDCLADVLAHNADYADWLRAALAACGLNSLADMTITPVQRLPRYEMLLSSLLRHTDADHTDYGPLRLAYDSIAETNASIDRNSARRAAALDLCDQLARSDHNFNDRHVLEKNRLLANGLLCHSGPLWIVDVARTVDKHLASSAPSPLGTSTSSSGLALSDAGASSLGGSSSASALAQSLPPLSFGGESACCKVEHSAVHTGHLFNSMLVLCCRKGKKVQKIYSWPSSLDDHRVCRYSLFGAPLFRLIAADESGAPVQLYLSAAERPELPDAAAATDAWADAFSSALKKHLYVKAPPLASVDYAEDSAPLNGELEVRVVGVDGLSAANCDVYMQVEWSDQQQCSAKKTQLAKAARRIELGTCLTFMLCGSQRAASALKFELFALDPAAPPSLLGSVVRPYFALDVHSAPAVMMVPLVGPTGVLSSTVRFQLRYTPTVVEKTGHLVVVSGDQAAATRGRSASTSGASSPNVACLDIRPASPRDRSSKDAARSKSPRDRSLFSLKGIKEALGKSTAFGLGQQAVATTVVAEAADQSELAESSSSSTKPKHRRSRSSGSHVTISPRPGSHIG